VFVVIGEALIDMVQPEPGDTFVAKVGGGPLNIAVGLQRLGHPTHMMARFSTGSLGGLVRSHAESNGLDLSASVTTTDPTTLAFATLDAHGHASYDFYVDGTADWGWTADELAQLPAGARAVHTGSVAAAISPGADALLALWQRLHADGRVVLSFDPNIRPALVGERSAAVARAEAFVAVSHVVKASDEDLGWLYPDDALADVLRRWARMGPDLVVMTRGAQGCIAETRSGLSAQRSGVVVDVVDTIGAGDSFESGLLSGLADANLVYPTSLAQLSRPQLDSVLQRAAAVSAITCGRAGADPPSRAEYEAVN
jgi:fructokinase